MEPPLPLTPSSPIPSPAPSRIPLIPSLLPTMMVVTVMMISRRRRSQLPHSGFVIPKKSRDTPFLHALRERFLFIHVYAGVSHLLVKVRHGVVDGYTRRDGAVDT
jgi:hypothetical protein